MHKQAVLHAASPYFATLLEEYEEPAGTKDAYPVSVYLSFTLGEDTDETLKILCLSMLLKSWFHPLFYVNFAMWVATYGLYNSTQSITTQWCIIV